MKSFWLALAGLVILVTVVTVWACVLLANNRGDGKAYDWRRGQWVTLE